MTPTHPKQRLCSAACRRGRARERQRVWQQRHPEQVKAIYDAKNRRTQEYRRNWALNRKYKLDSARYAQLLEQQGGLCAICREASPKPLHVDHDHSTGAVRGLLCARCNVGLGFLDKSAWRDKAIAYLEGDEAEG